MDSDNLFHSTNAQHGQTWFNTHVPGYNAGHPLTQQTLYNSAIPQVAFEQICSAYAYQQQQRAQLIVSHHQSATEVLDLSQRESFESTSTMPKTPPSYQTNWDNAESPARSRHIYANNGEEKESQQPQQIPVNLLYNAQHQMGPFGPFYPTLYNSIDNISKEVKAATTPSQALALTPPSSNTPLFSPQPQTSPISNDSVVVAGTAAATNTASTRHNVSVKSEDMCIAPLSPISSHDGRSRSPIRSTQNVLPTNSSTPSSSDVLRALQTTTRPFKAFPRDPLVIAANFAATDILLDIPRTESYKEYRSRMLKQMKTKNGGSLTVTNPKMRRINTRRSSSGSNNAAECVNSEGDERHGVGADESSDCDSSITGCQVETNNSNSNDDNNKNDAASNNSSSGGQVKDAAYYERRRKNNAAAKKSRDRRRIKEDEIALRAAFLERQNIQLLSQITTLKQQLAAFTSKAVSA
ncbi:protein giant isoform X2 [Ceratitis capitata]|uniref:protein giant isoform X2 n=1 Tax=Ceratitis capitata TaxID=7213 RepID=UPI000329FF4D|nr:protein giant isoform X2 [Ceratitis capitata]